MGPKTAGKQKVARTKPINSEIRKTGVMRLSRGRMFHKRGLWHVEKWRKQNEKKPEDKRPKKPTRVVEKQVGGDKNGGKRRVRVSRFPRSYPTEDRPRKLRTNRKAFSQHKHSLRKSITPGTVLILVAGRHAGKRVVFLKQLKSGLLLVTGPFKLNGCPLRRINQIYVIATSTRVDLSKVNVPENLNDSFFNRVKAARKQKTQGSEIFETKKEQYKVNDERKQAQLNVDNQLLAAIKSNPERRLLRSYLKSRFALTNKVYPHKLKF
jgi:large subunit ribosomal protein L6e